MLLKIIWGFSMYLVIVFGIWLIINDIIITIVKRQNLMKWFETAWGTQKVNFSPHFTISMIEALWNQNHLLCNRCFHFLNVEHYHTHLVAMSQIPNIFSRWKIRSIHNLIGTNKIERESYAKEEQICLIKVLSQTQLKAQSVLG